MCVNKYLYYVYICADYIILVMKQYIFHKSMLDEAHLLFFSKPVLNYKRG